MPTKTTKTTLWTLAAVGLLIGGATLVMAHPGGPRGDRIDPCADAEDVELCRAELQAEHEARFYEHCLEANDQATCDERWAEIQERRAAFEACRDAEDKRACLEEQGIELPPPGFHRGFHAGFKAGHRHAHHHDGAPPAEPADDAAA
ncbi:MAG: hypothetical protein ACPGQL_00055 [Thermoplasmatota archaeon]